MHVLSILPYLKPSIISLMEIQISNLQSKKIDEELIRRVVEGVLRGEKVNFRGELSIALVDEDTIRVLNKKYRKKDSPTDVLSFPLSGKEDKDVFVGEIIISPEVVKKQAMEFKTSFKEELVLLLIHGVLHLLGYSHKKKEENRIMKEKERTYLEKLLGDANEG